MSSNVRNFNQDLNLKASIMSLSNIDDELKYYNKYLNLRKEINEIVERKKGTIINEIKEKESILNFQRLEKEKKEQENKELLVKFNQVCKKENEFQETIKNTKEEIMKKFLAICQKIKEI
jgi:hypothetical protein